MEDGNTSHQFGGNRRGGWRGGGGGDRGGGGGGRGRGGYGKWTKRGGKWRGGGYYNHYGANQDRSNSSSQRSRPTLVQSRLSVSSPYKGWILYFPDEVYSDQSLIANRVKIFDKYFSNWAGIYDMADIERKGSFIVNFEDLLSDKFIEMDLPDLKTELRDSPEKFLACLGLAMHQTLTVKKQKELDPSDQDGLDDYVPIINARILGYDTIVPLKNIKASYYGKYVCVKGTVVRVSNVKPMCTKMAFECNSCSTIQTILFPDGKYITPIKCTESECRSKIFIPKRSSSLTESIDWQTLRLQEIMGDDQKESGRIPRTIDCELTNDLVDSCVPGDVVSISGIVKVNNSDEGFSKNKDKCMFLLFIHANSVSNPKGNKNNTESGSGLAMDFTIKELYAIEEIQSEKNIFKLLVGSVCPSIFGHEMVKAGLVLGLFGGTPRFINDKNRIPVRGDPHILIVGDPGLGKSQMLQAVSSIAPRSVYVCGNTTTASGLTVTLCKDSGSNDHSLEAGALVLADQGCCCIDEFDKMSAQHQALLEAMEQQSISIAKAGIVCSLPARASIIAAANPVGGHYTKSKTVSENLKMGGALLSRFDLVFILLDKPDEIMDNMLSEHVMALHAGKKQGLSVTVNRSQLSLLEDECHQTLQERLTIKERMDFIPAQLFRKYVAYARKYVHPRIGKEAAHILQKFYLDLRRQHQTQDSTPITTRQLESLIRLTEARARVELREEASKQDAEDVVAIMKYSMKETYSDEFGLLDFRRSQHGSGMSSRSGPKKFISLLQRRSEQTYNSLFTVHELKQLAEQINISTVNFENFISSLNNQGYLLKKGPKVYQLQVVDY